uniref:MULE transposase domain-containing protein n=1 Tax=Lactuca sativa TaxID=4236 RepID=A0A9R1XXJ4_LACSA|nr:hypothetical protein LSAT_V11C100010060 [Lactuca sativa]
MIRCPSRICTSCKQHFQITKFSKMAGFHTRLSCQSKYNSQIIKNKYVICNRGGKDKPKPCDTLATSSIKRKPNSNKIINGCTTNIIFENLSNSLNCTTTHFIEDRPYMKKGRKMLYSEKEFVVHASKAKIGPTMAYKIRAVLKGGYEYVGAKDAQIMINKMNNRRDHYPNYSFEFLRVEINIFWADEREKAFYTEFRDVISFDASFRTNKYKMVFVPFTTVDHHKKSVAVGARLLSRETIESYEWLLKAFLRAHEEKAPKIVLTDQDPTTKQAVESVLPNSRHRLCMWHITKKLQAKPLGLEDSTHEEPKG